MGKHKRMVWKRGMPDATVPAEKPAFALEKMERTEPKKAAGAPAGMGPKKAADAQWNAEPHKIINAAASDRQKKSTLEQPSPKPKAPKMKSVAPAKAKKNENNPSSSKAAPAPKSEKNESPSSPAEDAGAPTAPKASLHPIPVLDWPIGLGEPANAPMPAPKEDAPASETPDSEKTTDLAASSESNAENADGPAASVPPVSNKEGVQLSLAPPSPAAGENPAAVLEAALFMSSAALTAPELAKLMGTAAVGRVHELMTQLSARYEKTGSAVEVVEETPGRWAMRVRARFAPAVRALAGESEIPKHALRTLAYISKNEGVKKRDLFMRLGSTIYGDVAELVEKGFVTAAPSGRTTALRTTPKFKRYFEG